MRVSSTRPAILALAAAIAVAAPATVPAQDQGQADPRITVTADRPADPTTLPDGPEVKGFISARAPMRIQVTTEAGTKTVIGLHETTKIKNSGLFGGGKNLTAGSLMNGLPVTVKTGQSDAGLVAKQVTFRKGDLKTAAMIRNGTQQQFDEQTAATEALRGRMADIDKYNIKGTTNVFFDTGKWNLSERAKSDLCAAATAAESTENALMLVVGYTDTVGDDDYNQTLSEKRAAKVINYLQQVCHWKPYRMLTPTGMAKADPLASNDTEEGRAQNRRVAVNILVSKSVDVN